MLKLFKHTKVIMVDIQKSSTLYFSYIFRILQKKNPRIFSDPSPKHVDGHVSVKPNLFRFIVVKYRDGPRLSDRQCRPRSDSPFKTAADGRVDRSGSILIARHLWTHYVRVNPHCSSLRIITAIISAVRLFSDFYDIFCYYLSRHTTKPTK